MEMFLCGNPPWWDLCGMYSCSCCQRGPKRGQRGKRLQVASIAIERFALITFAITRVTNPGCLRYPTRLESRNAFALPIIRPETSPSPFCILIKLAPIFFIRTCHCLWLTVRRLICFFSLVFVSVAFFSSDRWNHFNWCRWWWVRALFFMVCTEINKYEGILQKIIEKVDKFGIDKWFSHI